MGKNDAAFKGGNSKDIRVANESDKNNLIKALTAKLAEQARIDAENAKLAQAKAEAEAKRAAEEKALADKIYQGDSSTIRNIRDLESRLTEHLRIDQDSLSQLDHRLMAEIAGQSRSKKLSLLSEYIKSGEEPA